MIKEEIEKIRQKLSKYPVRDMLVRHNPTGKYYVVVFANAKDLDTKATKVVLMSLQNVGNSYVMDYSSFHSTYEKDGVILDRFSPAINDDKAIEVLHEVLLKNKLIAK